MTASRDTLTLYSWALKVRYWNCRKKNTNKWTTFRGSENAKSGKYQESFPYLHDVQIGLHVNRYLHFPSFIPIPLACSFPLLIRSLVYWQVRQIKPAQLTFVCALYSHMPTYLIHCISRLLLYPMSRSLIWCLAEDYRKVQRYHPIKNLRPTFNTGAVYSL